MGGEHRDIFSEVLEDVANDVIVRDEVLLTVQRAREIVTDAVYCSDESINGTGSVDGQGIIRFPSQAVVLSKGEIRVQVQQDVFWE